MKTARSTAHRPLAWLGLLLVMAALAITAGTAPATTGPNQVSIASSGGWVACLSGIASGDHHATFESIQGTRHPYQGAAYTAANGVIDVTLQIRNDDVHYLYEGNSQLATQRIDNQAATSGNGLYQCKAIP